MSRALGTAVFTVCVLLTLSAPAGAVVTLGPTAGTGAPQVIVDATGQGYTTWASSATGQSLEYCRLTILKPACASRQSFSYPAASQSEDKGNTPVFTANGDVALLDSRCCLFSNEVSLHLLRQWPVVRSAHGTGQRRCLRDGRQRTRCPRGGPVRRQP